MSNSLLFQKTRGQSNEDAEKVGRSFESLALHARILTCILASTSFTIHMNVLLSSGLLQLILPMFGKVTHYEDFSKLHKMGFLRTEARESPDGVDDLDDSEREGYPKVSGDVESSESMLIFPYTA